MSEYDDVNKNPDITKVKTKEPVVTVNSTAELVGFKSSDEAAKQMKEAEDAVRNDLPSLEKRGEVVAPRKGSGTAADESIEPSSKGVLLDEKETDKYSSRLDNALAKLEEEAQTEADENADDGKEAQKPSLPESEANISPKPDDNQIDKEDDSKSIEENLVKENKDESEKVNSY